MSRNLKIEKINAYKKMIESKKLPAIKEEKSSGPRNPEDPSTYSVEEQIHMEFTGWAEGQLADLLGEGNGPRISGDFTDEQVEVLQQFADKMLAKASQQEAPVPASRPQQPQNRTGNTGGYKPPSNAEPIGNRLRNNQNKRGPQTKQEKYLSELEDLDRNYDPEN